jgi:hypothetical protein
MEKGNTVSNDSTAGFRDYFERAWIDVMIGKATMECGQNEHGFNNVLSRSAT